MLDNPIYFDTSPQKASLNVIPKPVSKQSAHRNLYTIGPRALFFFDKCNARSYRIDSS